MSDIEFDFEDESQDQVERVNPVRARMRELESTVKSQAAKLREYEAAVRENAFIKAGAPMDNPMTKYFMKGYDGDYTPEAIRAALEEANLIQAQKPVQQDKGEQDAWNRLQRASRSGETSEPVVDWAQRFNQASSPQELENLMSLARQELDNNNY